jgi:hypothetical protein
MLRDLASMELLEKHLLAFADHAAEFYAGSGNDSKRALELARVNVANRPTRRAVEQARAIAVKADRLQRGMGHLSARFEMITLNVNGESRGVDVPRTCRCSGSFVMYSLLRERSSDAALRCAERAPCIWTARPCDHAVCGSGRSESVG